MTAILRPATPKRPGAPRRSWRARGDSLFAAGRCLLLLLVTTSCGARTWIPDDASPEECGTPPAGPNAQGITQLALGPAHSCALLDDGTVRCWGSNRFGELGDGGREDRSRPAPVEALGAAVRIACGGEPGCGGAGDSPTLCAGGQTCAVLQGGTVSCWGDVDGTAQPSQGITSPTPVDGLSDVIDVAIGRREHCALRRDGTVQCWDGGRAVHTIEGVSDAVQLAVGGGHACALRSGGTVTCWGAFDYDLGNGTDDRHGPDVPPTEVAGLTGVLEITTREKHVCARMAGGVRACWGTNARGELGPAPEPPLSANRPVVQPPLACGEQLALGAIHTCQRLVDGRVACWGDGLYGKLGRTLLPDDDDLLRDYLRAPTPAVVEGLGSVLELALGGEHACVTTATEVSCWGRNQAGQLGDETEAERARPTPVHW